MKLKELLSVMDKEDRIVVTDDEVFDYKRVFPEDDFPYSLEFSQSTIENLLKQEDKLEREVRKIKYMNEYDFAVWFEVYLEKPKTVSSLQLGDIYYYIKPNGRISSTKWEESTIDYTRLVKQNVFLTYESAEKMAREILQMIKDLNNECSK